MSVTREAVFGGHAVTQIGVVALLIRIPGTDNVSNCSGVLLNRFAIVTAAHCFEGIATGGETKRVTLSAVYRQPDGTDICLTGGSVVPTSSNINPRCFNEDEYDVSLLPGWKPRSIDAVHDFAVLRSVNVFEGVSPSDYAMIDVGTVSSSGRMDFYGYGRTGTNGTSGALNIGTGQIDAVNPQHINLVAGGARACSGDSGGPAALSFTQTAPNLVVEGVLSNTSGTSTCAPSGGLERFSRIGPKMDFVQQKLGFTCPTVVLGSLATGHLVQKCFYPLQAFWSRANNLYVQASNRGRGPLIAASSTIGQAETFEMLTNPDGTTSFVALVNDSLVTAEDRGDSPLIARATQVGEWEKFRLANFFFDGFSGTSITAVVNGKYVAAEAAGAQPLIARTVGNPAQWEQFFFNPL